MKILLTIGKRRLVVESEVPEICDYFLSLKYLHNFSVQVSEGVKHRHGLFCLKAKSGKKFKATFDKKDKVLFLKLDWKIFNRTDVMEKLLSQLLFVSNLEDEIFPVHASAVVKNGKAYLMIGPTGSGKTSLSMALCFKKGFDWMADDEVGLTVGKDGIYVSQVDDLISFRKLPFSILKGHITVGVVDKICFRFTTIDSPWVKTAPPFKCEDLGFKKPKLPIKVEGVFFPTIVTSYHYCDKAPKERAGVLMYNEFAKSICGVGSYILNNFGEIVSRPVVLETGKWGEISDFVNRMARTCQSYILQGPFEQVLSDITSTILENNDKR